MISATIGRRSVMALILGGFFLSFVMLWWVGNGGAISYNSAAAAVKKLMAHYVPLLAILAGFYFSERTVDSSGNQTSTEAFILAIAVVTLWAMGPPVLIALSKTIQAAMGFLDAIGVIGSSLTSACLAFYFSKSGKSENAK